MERGQPFNADGLVEFGECPFIALSPANIVACGKSMLGIEAHPQALAFSGGIEHSDDVLETVAEIRSLARCDLQGHFHLIARACLVNFIERTGDGLDALVFS